MLFTGEPPATGVLTGCSSPLCPVTLTFLIAPPVQGDDLGGAASRCAVVVALSRAAGQSEPAECRSRSWSRWHGTCAVKACWPAESRSLAAGSAFVEGTWLPGAVSPARLRTGRRPRARPWRGERGASLCGPWCRPSYKRGRPGPVPCSQSCKTSSMAAARRVTVTNSCVRGLSACLACSWERLLATVSSPPSFDPAGRYPASPEPGGARRGPGYLQMRSALALLGRG